MFLLPEMLGDYTLVPYAAVMVVGRRYVLDRGIDRAAVSAGERLPTGVRDEDA